MRNGDSYPDSKKEEESHGPGENNKVTKGPHPYFMSFFFWSISGIEHPFVITFLSKHAQYSRIIVMHTLREFMTSVAMGLPSP